MCDCPPGYHVQEYTNAVQVDIPPHMEDYKVNRQKEGLSPNGTITIDKCIVPEIQWLWNKGIRTYGSCCGHNWVPAFVNVHDDDIERMKAMGYMVWYNPCGVNREDAFLLKTVPMDWYFGELDIVDKPDIEALAQLELDTMPASMFEGMVDKDRKELPEYHESYGRHLRNKYKLWSYKWEPEIKNNVDCSPDHPDQTSMRIIERIWEILQERSCDQNTETNSTLPTPTVSTGLYGIPFYTKLSTFLRICNLKLRNRLGK